MNNNFERRLQKRSAIAVIVGSGISVLIMFALSFVIAWLISDGILNLSSVNTYALPIIFISTFIGNIVCLKNTNEKKLLMCMIQAGSIMGVITTVCMLLGNGISKNIYYGLVMVLGAAILSFGIAVMMPKKTKWR